MCAKSHEESAVIEELYNSLKKPTIEELSDGFKTWCKDIREILLPDKPKRLRDLSKHTFKDTHYKKTVLTQIENVKQKNWWKKFWED